MEQHNNHNENRLNRDGIRGIIRELMRPFIHLAMLLVSAGKIVWINAWMYFALFLIIQIIYNLILMKVNPQVLNERGKAFRPNTKTFDKVFYAIGIPFGLGIFIVAGLDVRYGWSEVPLNMNVIGFLVFIPPVIFGLWAMMVNSFFSITVRIQEEEGHQVCTSGPYKIVRHPGYISFIIAVLGLPLILGSWIAYCPGAVMIILIIIRTALEDRTLQRELPGYKEYTIMTKYRLIPFVW